VRVEDKVVVGRHAVEARERVRWRRVQVGEEPLDEGARRLEGLLFVGGVGGYIVSLLIEPECE
jgi:hypothetical protein